MGWQFLSEQKEIKRSQVFAMMVLTIYVVWTYLKLLAMSKGVLK